MVGDLLATVIYLEFHRNRARGLRDMGVEISPLPLTWPLTYTTAYTSRDFSDSFLVVDTINCQTCASGSKKRTEDGMHGCAHQNYHKACTFTHTFDVILYT